jgi:hypothetical protein
MAADRASGVRIGAGGRPGLRAIAKLELARVGAASGAGPGQRPNSSLLSVLVVGSSLLAGCIQPSGARSDEPEFVALRERCEADDATACVTLAERLFWGGADNSFDIHRRFLAAERACRLGEPNGCAIAGVTSHFYIHDDDRQASQFLRKGCSEGSFAACYALHDFRLDEGAEIRPDPARTLYFLEAACARGHAVECSNAGVVLLARSTTKVDTDRGVGLLRRACEEAPAQCNVLAAFSAGSDGAKVVSRSVTELCARYRKGYLEEPSRTDANPEACPVSFSRFRDANIVRFVNGESPTPSSRSE